MQKEMTFHLHLLDIFAFPFHGVAVENVADAQENSIYFKRSFKNA